MVYGLMFLKLGYNQGKTREHWLDQEQEETQDMNQSSKITLYALDCGAVNWRLYRMEYHYGGEGAQHVTSPLSAPLSSFKDRRLPAVLTLNEDGSEAAAIGEVSLGHVEDESIRHRVREFFKPSIGSHLLEDPLPHQKRYSHFQALLYTRLLLTTLLQQIQEEKNLHQPFDEQVHFMFSYPDSWETAHEGKLFDDFSHIVLECFPPELCEQVHFVPESEGVVLGLRQQKLLNQLHAQEFNLIVDVGGSTTTIYARKFDPETGDLVNVDVYQEPFGGGLYDAVLAKYLSDSLDITPDALASDPAAFVTLRLLGQELKESLSDQILEKSGNKQVKEERMITLVTRDGRVFRSYLELDRQHFEKICRHLDQKFQQVISRGLESMELEEEEVGRVILIGGGFHLPGLVQELQARFGSNKIILPDHPEEVIVRGIGLSFADEAVEWPEGEFQPGEPSSWKLVDDEGNLIPLDREIIIVGRSKEADLQLRSTKVSRSHALFKLEKGELLLTDLGSKNGTLVNEYPLEAKKTHLLQGGDQLTFADKRFTLIEE